MEGAAVIVFSVVARLLSLASVVLGFIADTKKLKPNDIYYSQGKCVYPSNPAFGLGIVALSLLVAAQIIVSLVGCCSGNGGATGSRRVWGNVCYALSWVAAVIAVVLYVQGVVWSAATTRSPEVISTMLFMRQIPCGRRLHERGLAEPRRHCPRALLLRLATGAGADADCCAIVNADACI
ncbi:hypothetical protein PR202_gb01342 [Eleusine coracana subsp. coracana]|uniref:CASP-like protein n=1 Tax=Eleusine coracana subsp. coracana TaxID=191504 RepID=A0AAV5DU56_ELECO|nr:hypothetical protein PR202_gb01342 [Eleusine coracana subsp. coracana]